MKAYITIVLVLFALGSNGQIITTFAGGGTSGLGDGGPATDAMISIPWGTTFDINGNFYIAEGGDNRIRKVDINGVISTVAGTGDAGYNGDNMPATLAMLNAPNAIAVDRLGNLYITDVGNNRIRRIDAVTDTITTVAGTGVAGYGGDGGLAAAAMLNSPAGLCFDKAGNLYIADNANFRIRKVNTNGIITTYAGTGDTGITGDGGPAVLATFRLIDGLATDNIGNLYVADWDGCKVRKIDTSGIISTFAGTGVTTYNGDNIPATEADIVPVTIAFDKIGDLFIADFYNNVIQKIDLAGIVHTVAGDTIYGYSGDGGPADSAELDGVSGIAVDTCGNLYISQIVMPRIRKVTYPNCIATGVNSIAHKSTISIYPNPAYSNITISSGSIITSITLTNLLGQTIFKQQYNGSNREQIDIARLPVGVYFIKVNDNYVQKMVKE